MDNRNPDVLLRISLNWLGNFSEGGLDRKNQLVGVLVVLILPLQYFFLREPNGLTDPAGVAVTIVQWILLTVVRRPFRAKQ